MNPIQMGRDWNNELYASIAPAPGFDTNDYWVKHGGNRATYELYRRIMDTARRELGTSEGLRKAYVRHKTTVFQCVKDNDIEHEVAEKIAGITPYFYGTMPDSTIALFKAYYKADTESYSATEAAWREIRAHGLTISDLRAYEFVERRRAEGGDALVAAWAWVLTDFGLTLSPPSYGVPQVLINK